MPYTPPSQQQSPASPATNSPGYSRAHTRLSASSQNNGFSSPPVSPGPRPKPPRSHSSSASTDYLSKNRRSPAFQDFQPTSAQVEYARAMAETHERKGLSLNTSIRKSPPPLTDNATPVGMLVSPPDSTQNSSDDETPHSVHLEHDSNQLAELEKAVRQSLGTDRRGSPEPTEGSNGAKSGEDNTTLHVPHFGVPRHSAAGRKVSHARARTESAISQSHSSTVDSGDEDDDDQEQKPPLIRKKSGELVKPAIRPHSRRRHSSMPGTPTYSKAVHFNDNIEQVRHFLQVDRPIAVSAGGSPVESHDDATEFPFGSHTQDWELRLVNFPRDTLERASQPIRVENLYLSADQKCLIGNVAVANLAFHKTVHARFTFDLWKTTSEVMAEFNNDPRLQVRSDGYDQFTFSIKLTDHTNLESKTLLLCMRYAVNGQEYWDNNNNANYQVELRKKAAPEQPVKPAIQSRQRKDSLGLGSNPSLPRSRHNSPGGRRPRSMPSFDDDFSSGFDGGSYFDLRSRGNSNTLGKKKSFDNPPVRVNTSGQQFGSRYDFGASLTAALNQAQASMGPESRGRSKDVTPPPSTTESMARVGIQVPNNSGTDSPRPDTLLASRQSLDSQAYQDFVSRFCFFGSGKPANDQSPGALAAPNTSDGADDTAVIASASQEPAKGAVRNESAQGSAPRELSAGTGGFRPPPPRFLSPKGSGSNSPSGRSSPMSFGFPFQQRSGFFTPESQTSSVHG